MAYYLIIVHIFG